MRETDWIASLKDALAAAGDEVLARLPSLLGAAALVLAGWLIARLLRFLTVRSLDRARTLIGGREIDAQMRTGGIDRFASGAAGALVFWLVLLVFVAAAGEVLGLAVISTGLDRLASYLPTVLGAVVVLVAGVVVGNLARAAVIKAATRARLASGEMLARVLRGVILLVTAVVALDQIGIDSELLITATNVLIAAVVGGAALAFALGSRTSVGNILALHYVMQTYKVGQRIRLDDVEGEIVEFKKTGVVVRSDSGDVWIPGSEFSERRSVLVEGRRS